ncbi:helix-turn-helix domain-containing protein [Actinoallomurus iriomotensis]|uniref:Membrane protein n=1 Tax=Actinoallomurus iriomotensis TaxID=478107 RepID=A0A9W6VMH1_9ACTN|nr:helix-turn-helix domain-containing protein [Actinoallomurus iriomotensis]GLY72457.1 membrane protein [Actinoallomurus iriomotensis]
MTERSEGTVVGDGAGDEGASSIGDTLAKARRDAGLTVGQVADRTRIRETVINAIERDDYTLCGGNFYARGHIRSIARATGIDPEPLIGRYDDAHGGSPQAIPARQAFEPETPVRFRERRAPNWSAAMIVALVLVALYGIVRVATGHDEHHAAQRAAAPATAKPAPRSHTVSPSPAPRKDVTVRVKAKRASWLNVRDAKGKELFSGMIRAGQSEEWKSKKRIRLLIGNGGGVRVTVNGKDVGAPGETGQVIRLSYGPRDPLKAGHSPSPQVPRKG